MAQTGEKIDSKIFAGSTEEAAKERHEREVMESRAGEAEQAAPVLEPQVVVDQVDRQPQVIDAQSALTGGVFGARCQTSAVLLDEEKRLLRREKTRKKTGVTNTRRALLVAIGQHRLAYEIEGLLDEEEHYHQRKGKAEWRNRKHVTQKPRNGEATWKKKHEAPEKPRNGGADLEWKRDAEEKQWKREVQEKQWKGEAREVQRKRKTHWMERKQETHWLERKPETRWMERKPGTHRIGRRQGTLEMERKPGTHRVEGKQGTLELQRKQGAEEMEGKTEAKEKQGKKEAKVKQGIGKQEAKVKQRKQEAKEKRPQTQDAKRRKVSNQEGEWKSKWKTLQGQSKRKGQRQIIYVGTEADAEDFISFDWSQQDMFWWGEQKPHDIFPKQGQG